MKWQKSIMTNDLVSVVIPSHGGGEFLKRSIDSVLSQTYDNVEVIVVDDNGIGSEAQIRTSIVMSLYVGNNRVKYICHKVNRNGSAARNTGVRNSSGKYVAFLDDDDEYYPDNIETQVKVFEELPDEYGMTYCGRQKFYNNQLVSTSDSSHSGDILYEYLMHRIEIGSPGFLMKKELYENLGGFDESFLRHQDWEFLCRVISQFKVKGTGRVGYRVNICQRHKLSSPDKVKECRIKYLNKISLYCKRLTNQQQMDIFRQDIMVYVFEYLKCGELKSFLREYHNASLGFYGIKFFLNEIFRILKRGKIRIAK